jgi:hypothetical protein
MYDTRINIYFILSTYLLTKITTKEKRVPRAVGTLSKLRGRRGAGGKTPLRNARGVWLLAVVLLSHHGPRRHLYSPLLKFCRRSYLHPQSILRAVARGHGGAVPFIVVVEGEGWVWLLAPGPPCERVLAAVGDGCWEPSPSSLGPLSVSLSPFHLRSSPRAVAREGGGGQCVVGRRCRVVCRQSPVLVSSVVPAAVLSPTNDPPHEQLLVRLGWVVWLLGRRRLVAPSIHPTSSCS